MLLNLIYKKFVARQGGGKVFVVLLFCCLLFFSCLAGFLVFASTDDITDLSVAVSPQSFQTWDDLTAGTSPPDLYVTLYLTVSENYVTGGTIELPLSYTPDSSSHLGFTYGTDGTNGVGSVGGCPPFFELDTDALDGWVGSSLNSVVDSYVVSGDVLVLTLKSKSDADFSAGVKSIPVKFVFNRDWASKVPGGTTLWSVAPVAKVDNVEVDTAAAMNVVGAAHHGISVTLSPQNPSTTNYYDGAIIARARVNNYDNVPDNAYYQLQLDPNYSNIVWLEVPTGSSSLSSNALSYYTGTPIVGPSGDVLDGFTRYWRLLNPNPTDSNYTDWNYWHYNGIPSSVFMQMDFTFTPPLVSDGETITIRNGVDYKVINGDTNSVSIDRTYTKYSRPTWDLYFHPRHGGADTSGEVVCGLSDGSISNRALTASYYNYANSGTTKNIGSGPITGVSFEIYHVTNPNTPAKMNFNTAVLYPTRDPSDEPNFPDWSTYKVQYEIYDYNANSGAGGFLSLVDNNFGTTEAPLYVWTPTGSEASQSVSLDLPVLSQGQYISRIIVTPMGTDGTSEGVWPSLNGFCLTYTAKAWNGQVWPDGSAVPAYSAVPMAWKMIHDNNPEIDNAVITEQGNTANMRYTDAPYALASMTSSNSMGRLPGDTVDYTIFGYNHGGFVAPSAGSWFDPRIVVRVPIFMEFTGLESANIGDHTTLSGLGVSSTPSGNSPAPLDKVFDVKVTLVDQYDGYNYYSFQAVDYTALRGSGYNPVFTIPASFVLSNQARPGTYDLQLLLTSEDAENFLQGYSLYNFMDTLSALSIGNAANYGLGGNDHYYVMRGSEAGVPAVSSLVVPSVATMVVKTTIKSDVTNDLWVDCQVVPAVNGEEVFMKLTLTNRGSVELTSIRLYDILPYNGDLLGSSGVIEFVSVVPDGTAQIYYTTTAPTVVYGEHGSPDPDLQTNTFWNSWSMTPPSTPSNTRAFVIDFGTLVLDPNESLEIILTFQVPSSGSQTVYNQFFYSAIESDSGTKLNLPSPKAGFSTEAIGIFYDANLPTVTATPDGLSGIPSASFSMIGLPPAVDHFSSGTLDSLQVSSAVPVLAGYTFAGWNTEVDGSGDWWGTFASLGETLVSDWKQFTESGALVLYAQWTANTYAVTFDANTLDTVTGPTPSSKTVTFGEAYGTLASVDCAGYTFLGWYPFRTTGTEVEDTTVVTTVGDHTLYAQWSAVDYVVVYDTAGGSAAPVDSSSYNVGDTVTVVTDVPTRAGFVFGGWLSNVTGDSTVYGHGSSQTDSFVMPADDVKLTAQWVPAGGVVDSYLVTYDGNGASGGVAPVDSNNPYSAGDEVVVLGEGSLVRDGFVFFGWSTDADAVVPSLLVGESFTIWFDVELFAVWVSEDSLGPFTVVYDPGAFGAWSAVDETYTGLMFGVVTPAAPDTLSVDEDWRFTGWDPEWSSVVTGDVVYVAQWVFVGGSGGDAFVVTFVDFDDSFIKNETVPYGGNATAPSDPVRAGYRFTGWDTDFTNVTSNLTVKALYTRVESSSSSSGRSSTATPKPFVSVSPVPSETPPPVTPTPPVEFEEPLFYWAVVNLVLGVVGVVLAIVLVVCALLWGRRKQEEVQPVQQRQRRLFWLFLGIVMGVAGIIVFLLTEDMSLQMGLVDRWTIVNAILFAVELVAIALTFKYKKDDDDNYDETTPTGQTSQPSPSTP